MTKYNFRIIENMKNGEDNCFTCRWNNENEADPGAQNKRCGLHKISTYGAKSGGKQRDCVCDDFELSKYFKGV